MKISNDARRHWEAVNAAPKDCLVYVTASHAKHFQSLPRDGHTYLVQDPYTASVMHCTKPDGSYTRLDTRNTGSAQVGNVLVQVNVKGKPRLSRKKGARVVDSSILMSSTTAFAADAPSICLIDINRVMRISGFKRSFIYDQPGFPKPVSLGASRRSASRWVEAEVIAWATALAETRESST